MSSKNMASYQLYKPRVNFRNCLDIMAHHTIRRRADWLNKYSPLSLELICSAEVNKLPTVSCWAWSTEEVGDWIDNTVGFPQYKECFIKNNISGRKLILVDANTLPKWNITNFEDIKNITAAIHKLLNVQPETWSRSISLPPRDPESLFLIYKQPTGRVYDKKSRSKILEETGYLIKRPKLAKNMWDRNYYEMPNFPKEIVGLWREKKS